MKKNILKLTLVAAFALVAGYNVYTSQKSSDVLSDVALANVEALARPEGDYGWGSTVECRNRMASKCNKFRYDSPWDSGTMIREDDMEYVN